MPFNRSVKVNRNWEEVQRPNQSLGKPDSSLQLLLTALDVGWEVKEPVYFRPLWSETGPWVYHFILLRTSIDQSYIITVPVEAEVSELIRLEGWRVGKPSGYSAP